MKDVCLARTLIRTLRFHCVFVFHSN